MDPSLAPLAERRLPFWETSFSALDAYFGLERAPVRFIAFGSDLVELARTFERLEFRSLPLADASLVADDLTIHFRCVDDDFRSDEGTASFAPLDLFRVPGTRRFFDPRSAYESVRADEISPGRDDGAQLFEAAVLLSRYGYSLPGDFLPRPPREMPPGVQRDLLALVLTSTRPERGFEFLRATGFVGAFWPELAALSGTSQSKEYHPEGDAWDHTLETFQYRKTHDLALSLALLLHDTGKPGAAAIDGKRFARHSEIGAGMARRFLARLGFDAATIDTVAYLVRWHMLPAALSRLPVHAAREAMEDRRFPLLLELYRCDELSTFRGPDGYYRACAAYREWLRNVGNPYRDEEGRKLTRLYVENVPAASGPVPKAGTKRAGTRVGGNR